MKVCKVCKQSAMCGTLHLLGPAREPYHAKCLHEEKEQLREQVTKLQTHNTREVERRRKVEAKLELQERLGGLCIRALGAWGEESQLAMCAEECAELGAEILRVLRGRKGHLPAMMEEGADVYITVMQLRLQNPVLFDQMVSEKLDRLENLLGMPA